MLCKPPQSWSPWVVHQGSFITNFSLLMCTKNERYSNYTFKQKSNSSQITINPNDAITCGWTFQIWVSGSAYRRRFRPVSSRSTTVHFNFVPFLASKIRRLISVVWGRSLAHDVSDKLPKMACPTEALIANSIGELRFKN